MRVPILLVLLACGPVPTAMDAQTFQICSNYPTSIQQDLADAKTQLLKTYNLKASTTNAQAQAYFVKLGIRAMLVEQTAADVEVASTEYQTESAALNAAHQEEVSGLTGAAKTRYEEFEEDFPNPAPPAVCGDGTVDPAEVCDDGPGGACKDDCTGTVTP